MFFLGCFNEVLCPFRCPVFIMASSNSTQNSLSDQLHLSQKSYHKSQTEPIMSWTNSSATTKTSLVTAQPPSQKYTNILICNYFLILTLGKLVSIELRVLWIEARILFHCTGNHHSNLNSQLMDI